MRDELGGLSPHIRGKPRRRETVRWWAGSIPAYTGETNRPFAVMRIAQVYPRIYGGNDFAAAELIINTGLSPHIRGKRRLRARKKSRTGSIPAYTGETNAP